VSVRAAVAVVALALLEEPAGPGLAEIRTAAPLLLIVGVRALDAVPALPTQVMLA
jgi:hypothetical protein